MAKELNLNNDEYDISLRPRELKDFIGQNKFVNNLKVYIEAAKQRGEHLDHILLSGPPGLGKTTLSNIVASEMGVNFKSTNAPVLTKVGDLAAILTDIQRGDIFFIDEIHRLNKSVEEILYTAMEDFVIDIVIGQGPAAKTLKIDIEPFTLIGATTRKGLLSSPLIARFGISEKLEFYNKEELVTIINRSARLLNVNIDKAAAEMIAFSSRGTPRVANRILRRIRDFAQINNSNVIDREVAEHSLRRLSIDSIGLDKNDIEMLKIIIEKYDGGPVGGKTIAISIGEEIETIEDVYEPYLIQMGLLKRTPKGRMATRKAYEHLGVPYNLKPEADDEKNLFNN